MTKAIILSGGKGTRLMPLTKNTPKPMLPIHGTPHLEYIIQLLKKHGINDIIFSTGYLHSKIVDYFGDGHDFGVQITYKEDGDTPLGTAGAIKNCEDLLDDEPFLVFNGDILTNFNIDNLISYHKVYAKGITLALAEVKDPWHYGLAVLDGDKICYFVEKPEPRVFTDNPKIPKVINAGIYVMDKAVLKDIPSGEFSMVETDVFPKYADSDNLYGYVSNKYWLDIGTFDRYDIANKDVKYKYFVL